MQSPMPASIMVNAKTTRTITAPRFSRRERRQRLSGITRAPPRGRSSGRDPFGPGRRLLLTRQSAAILLERGQQASRERFGLEGFRDVVDGAEPEGLHG